MLRFNSFRLWQRLIGFVLTFSLVIGPEFGYAQGLFVSTLPEPGAMVGASTAFVPVLVKGMVVHPDQPLNFDFIVDSGNDSTDQAVIKEQSERIAKYFLAAVTVPENQLWVNLSPFEKDRIIEEDLGQTILGRDMLAQDYVLKQLTASLIYPEQGLGKGFWSKVYQQAQEKFGTTDIPVDTFNKVWIMPDKAEVFEKGNAVYVTQAKLKVMLDSDRMAIDQNNVILSPKGEGSQNIAKQVLREIILPAIEKEVNEGRNFATIRQIYHAAILAKWYRELIQNTLLSDAYMGKNRVAGVTSDEKALKEQIYQRYIAAYKKGAFSLIKEEPDRATGDIIPKKYFSGGENLRIERLDHAETSGKIRPVGEIFKADVLLDTPQTSAASVDLTIFSDPNIIKGEIQNNWKYLPDPANRPASFSEFFRGPGDKSFARRRMGKFLIQYNPRRASRRPAAPRTQPSVFQPFDEKGFNYIQVDSERPAGSLFRNLTINGVSGVEIHNQPKPFSRLGHFLIVPEREKKLPNFLIKEAIKTAVGVVKASPGKAHLKVAFNSSLGFGTVNHLHLQTLYNESIDNPGEPGPMQIEQYALKQLLRKDGQPFEANGVTFNEVSAYPARAFVLESSIKDSQSLEDAVATAVAVLQKEPWEQEITNERSEKVNQVFRGQPHNLVFMKADGADERLRVYVFPRRAQTPSSFGVGTGIAFFELCGELIVTIKTREEREAIAVEEEVKGHADVAGLIRQAKVYDEIIEGAFEDELSNNVTVDSARFEYLQGRIEDAAQAVFAPLGLGAIWYGRQWPRELSGYLYPAIEEVNAHLKKMIDRVATPEKPLMIDTAASYGTSEKRIGNFFRQNPALRARVMIATKWGNESSKSWPNTSGVTKTMDDPSEYLTESLHRSIDNLGSVDVLYIHSASIKTLKDSRVREAMQEAKKQGVGGVRYIGATVSTKPDPKTDAEFVEAVNGGLYDWCDMIQLSPRIFFNHRELIIKLHRKGIAIILNSPVLQRLPGTDYRTAIQGLVKDPLVSGVLTGSRSHLDETIDYVKGSPAQSGGIDIQGIGVSHKDGSARIQFNNDVLRGVLQNGFNGFTPVIINITPISSPLPLLGIALPTEGDTDVSSVSGAEIPVGREPELAGV